MTADQLRMARALLRLSITDLAEIAGIDKMVIVRMEAGRRAQAATVVKLRKAIEERGVVFVGAIEPLIEPTVAMRYGTSRPGSSDESHNENGGPEEVPVDRMRSYWIDGDRLGRLSACGQKVISKLF